MSHLISERGLITVIKTLIPILVLLMAFATNIGALTNHAAVAAVAGSGYEAIDQEVLWLARALYSETKKPEEQALVAWVIRNRVESPLYPDTYKEVVLQYGQFSGLNARDKQYNVNVSLGYGDTSSAWDSALSIARAVYFADPILRPLPAGVMHFYSPVSVVVTPKWAQGIEPSHTVKDPATNTVRFAFYADVM